MKSEKHFSKETLIDPDTLTYEDRAFLAALRVPELREKIIALLQGETDCQKVNCSEVEREATLGCGPDLASQ